MKETQLGVIEARFADLIWQNAPLRTRELIQLCEKELDWKRTTTYTVLKKLCQRGIFKTEDSIVSVVISKNDFFALRSEAFVEETFNGSLPAFIAAFTSKKPLSHEELQEIKKMIRKFEEN